jgi:hypothetical protein
MFKKGVVIATAVVGSLLLAGCASQGSGSACGEPTAVPAAAPAPVVNTCKDMSSCKHKMKSHHHRHHVRKAMADNSSSSTTTSSEKTTTTTG